MQPVDDELSNVEAAELWLTLVHEFACHCEIMFEAQASWAKSVVPPPTERSDELID